MPGKFGGDPECSRQLYQWATCSLLFIDVLCGDQSPGQQRMVKVLHTSTVKLLSGRAACFEQYDAKVCLTCNLK